MKQRGPASRTPRLHAATLAAVALWLGGCAHAPGGAGAAGVTVVEGGRPPVAGPTPRQLLPRQIIVALPSVPGGSTEAARKALAGEYGVRETGAFPLASIGVDCAVFVVPDDQPLAAVMDRLRADPRVSLAEDNQLFRTRERGSPVAAPPPSGDAPLAYGPSLIRADGAHRSATGRGVTVAIVDTGVATDHPALAGRVAEARSFVEGGDRSFARDRHGTAVAGVIAAAADPKTGLVGVAPEARLLALKACWYADDAPAGSPALCSSWTLARAIDYAVTAGARVLNLSLNGPADPLLARLLERANERGVIVVAAGAEGGPEPGFPASLPSVIAALASDGEGRVALPPWAGAPFALAAPGVDVLTTVPAGLDFLSGSSIAAAHVTGVVALLLELRPRLSPVDARFALRASARSLPGDAARARRAALLDACSALATVTGQKACP